MKLMLDKSPAQILAYRERYQADFWQLRTPLTQYARAPGIPWGFDNGCFVGLDRPRWTRMLLEAEETADRPVFCCLPDIPFDAQRTVELFDHFKLLTNEMPRCLVLQDGIERVRIPWDDLEAVFIGGSDAFKIAPEAIAAARTAKMLGKWVHLGRVNNAARVRDWIDLADSGDGSGISRFDHMLEDVLAMISGKHPQKALI